MFFDHYDGIDFDRDLSLSSALDVDTGDQWSLGSEDDNENEPEVIELEKGKFFYTSILYIISLSRSY